MKPNLSAPVPVVPARPAVPQQRGGTTAVLQRVHAPRQLTLPLRPRG